MKYIKITPLLIVLIAIEVILILITLYYSLIDNKGGNALAAVIAFIGA